MTSLRRWNGSESQRRQLHGRQRTARRQRRRLRLIEVAARALAALQIASAVLAASRSSLWWSAAPCGDSLEATRTSKRMRRLGVSLSRSTAILPSLLPTASAWVPPPPPQRRGLLRLARNHENSGGSAICSHIRRGIAVFGTTREDRGVGSSDPTTPTTTTATAAAAGCSNGRSLLEPPNDRAVLLNTCLDVVLPSPDHGDLEIEKRRDDRRPSTVLMEAALRSLRDPAAGYDPRYGRPALRTYRAFVYPKKATRADDDELLLEAAAARTANQIDFLVKRQASRTATAVRNHDDPDALGDGDEQTNNKKFPITVVLDNLRGSFNVGSIFRTAEACGVGAIWTCGITPHPGGSGAEKVAKSALGADLLVPTRHFPTTRAALETLLRSESKSSSSSRQPPLVIALETTASSVLYTSVDYRPYYYDDDDGSSEGRSATTDDDVDPRSTDESNGHRGIALVLGNEVTGVDVELLKPLLPLPPPELNDDDIGSEPSSPESSTDGASRAADGRLVDLIVELPTHGQKNSLNVAAVAPVMLYEILRQWTTTS